MANQAAKYEIIFVLRDTTVVTRTRLGARHAHATMFGYPPQKAIFTMRYFPSRKAWRVFDLRERMFVARQNYMTLKVPKPSFETPDKDAALMWAELKLDG